MADHAILSACGLKAARAPWPGGLAAADAAVPFPYILPVYD